MTSFSPFVSFGKTFWAQVFLFAGFGFSSKDIIKQVPENSGVTPFRAFRNKDNGKIVVMVEPTHYNGAILHFLDNREDYNKWYDEHMNLKEWSKNRDM